MRLLWAVLLAAGPLASADRVPVLLELFTSEGCSSCPPADRLLQVFDRDQPAAGADLIVISEHVDYWNHDGWVDPYSSASFTERQQAYAARFKQGDPYTPELVVDGQAGLVGSDRAKATAAIAQALRQRKLTVSITPSGARDTAVIHVSEAASGEKASHADVYLVMASNRVQTNVERGENAGHSLSHVAVAYAFDKVAGWRTDGAFTRQVKIHLKPGAQPGETRVIAFVQDRDTGRILGVAVTKL
jgi:hypothetical protein